MFDVEWVNLVYLVLIAGGAFLNWIFKKKEHEKEKAKRAARKRTPPARQATPAPDEWAPDADEMAPTSLARRDAWLDTDRRPPAVPGQRGEGTPAARPDVFGQPLGSPNLELEGAQTVAEMEAIFDGMARAAEGARQQEAAAQQLAAGQRQAAAQARHAARGALSEAHTYQDAAVVASALTARRDRTAFVVPTDRRELQRLIVWTELLGPPLALRDTQPGEIAGG